MNARSISRDIIDQFEGACRVCDIKEIENEVFNTLGDDVSISDYNLVMEYVLDGLDLCDNCKEEDIYDNYEDEYQDRD